MGRAGHNPPSHACPSCTTPSKCWYVGARTVDGTTQHRYRCASGHSWVVIEAPEAPPPEGED